MCIFIWCVVSCRCCAHFRPISCAISRPFPNIHPSHVALLFNPKSSPICFCSQFKAHTSSPSLLLHFLSLFLVYPLLLSSLSDLVSFAVVSLTKLVLFMLLLHSNCVPQLGILLLCVLCLAICLCSSPNLVGMLSLTGSLLFGLLLVVDVDTQLVYLFSVCYFVFGLVIAVVGIAMNSVFGFVTFSVAIGLPVNSFLVVKLALLASGTLLNLALLVCMLVVGVLISFLVFALDRHVLGLWCTSVRKIAS